MLPYVSQPTKLRVLIALLVMVPVALIPTTAHAQTSQLILGTPHDFSRADSPPDGGCQVCHVPDGSEGNKGGEGTLEVYGMGIAVSGSDGMGVVTRLCLSCHDGLQASGDFYAGGFVDNGHPVSLEYDSFAREGLFPAEAVLADGLKLFRNGDALRIECATCHDPHDNSNGKFLRVSNQGDALCRSCHHM